jgi:hypothetical protein
MTPDSPPVSWREFADARDTFSRVLAKLDEEKADVKDVAALAKSFDGLKATLLWFIGILVAALVGFGGLVIALIQAGS